MKKVISYLFPNTPFYTFSLSRFPKLFIPVLIFFSFTNAFSQPRHSLAVTGGGSVSLFNEKTSVNNGRYGLNYNVEFNYFISPKSSLVFSYSDFYQSKPSQSYTLNYKEYAAGVRYYPAGNYFIDFLYGNYSADIRNSSGGVFFGIPFSNDDRFGASLGAGTSIEIFKNYNLLFKLKYNILFGEETTSFINMNAGLQTVNKSVDENPQRQYFAAVYGGMYRAANRSFPHEPASNISAEFGLSHGQWNFISGLSHSLGLSSAEGIKDDFNSRYSEFYAGARYLVGKERLKLFLEAAPSLYYAEIEENGIKNFRKGLGGNIGVGSEINIDRTISFILKYKVFVAFGSSKDVFPALLGGLKLNI